MAERQELIGVFRRVQFSIHDTSFFIGRLDDGITIVGVCSREAMIPGVLYRYTGRWEMHSTYGRQFKFDGYCRQEPKTVEQVLSYAKRHLFSAGVGIGPAKMRKMIDHKGPELVLNWIKSRADEVSQFGSIPLKKARDAGRILLEKESFENTRIDLTALFSSHGFSEKLVDVAIEELGASAMKVITRDPFTMMVRKWPGCGFQRCDALYMKLGLPQHKVKRQLMAVFHFMLRHGNGSIWFPYETLVKYIREVCGAEIDPRKSIELGLRSDHFAMFCLDGQIIISTKQASVEEGLVAFHLERLNRAH